MPDAGVTVNAKLSDGGDGDDGGVCETGVPLLPKSPTPSPEINALFCMVVLYDYQFVCIFGIGWPFTVKPGGH